MGFAQREELGVVVANCGSLVHINFETEGEIRKYSGLNLNSLVMAAFHLAAPERPELCVIRPRAAYLARARSRPWRRFADFGEFSF